MKVGEFDSCVGAPECGAKRHARPAPSIVAIITLHNGARWIEQSLRSILAQTLKPKEIVVVDDGSTDGGAGSDIVMRMAAEHGRVTLLKKANGGQSSARNFGVRHSSCNMIAFLDQDDAWYPNHLERLLRAATRYRSGAPLGWVYSNLDETDENDTLIHRNFLHVVPLLTGLPGCHPKTSLAACLAQDMFVLPSASLIMRDAFDRVGGFDERLRGYEDDDLFLRIFAAGYANVFIDESLSKWRIYPESASYTPRMLISRMIYAHKLIESFPNDVQRARYWRRDCIAPRFIRSCAAEYMRASRLKDGQLAVAALKGIPLMLPYVPLGKRLRWRALLPLLRNRLAIQAAHWAFPLVLRLRHGRRA